jgi:hypothetical protein
MAAGTASLPPKIADPATRTLAPAETASRAEHRRLERTTLVEGQDVQLLIESERHHELPLSLR